ncbi:hypothetical protein ACFUN8_25990 [Streptomyces sp. NPDC057307]|uniref:hypothetical protein n=1 Tax=Streptomyces sp. NPDC057307 TaxID=3346096 RepID=UPI0036364749
MSTMVTELGKRVVDRWATLLVLPGLLFVAGAWAARELGHTGFADVGQVERALDALADAVSKDPARLAVGAVVLPLLSAGAGLAAQACSTGVSRLWFGPWPRWLARPERRLTDHRARLWRARADAYQAAVARGAEQSELDVLAASRNDLGLGPPQRPTWPADRMAAVESRVWAWYRVDVAFAWPRLWLLLSVEEQDALRGAHDRVNAALALAGWGYSPSY